MWRARVSLFPETATRGASYTLVAVHRPQSRDPKDRFMRQEPAIAQTPRPAQAPARLQEAPIEVRRGASASDVYVAAKNQRSELRNQLESLEDKRRDLTNDLQGDDTSAEERPGVIARLKDVDARITSVDQQLAQANAAVATAAAVPGAIVEPPRFVRSGPPDEVFAIPIVFTIFVLAPIAIAYARRIWKRGATIISPIPNEVRQRLDQLGEAVESIGIEVERIGEGQRFMTRVLTEHNAKGLGVGAAQPIAVPQRAAHAAEPRAL